MNVKVQWDTSELAPITPARFQAAVRRALRKAGSTALRDMNAEATKRIRARKRLAPKYIKRAITMQRKGATIENAEWALKVSGEPVPLVAYPHRQTRRGVSVEVNRGKRTLVRGTFKATMKSGHIGIFRRRGKARLPIQELFGSRPIDALLHKGEAEGVAQRGSRSLVDTFRRLLPLELGK